MRVLIYGKISQKNEAVKVFLNFRRVGMFEEKIFPCLHYAQKVFLIAGKFLFKQFFFSFSARGKKSLGVRS